MQKFWNGLRHFIEWLIVYAFVTNAINIILYPAYFAAEGPIGEVVTSTLSLYIVAGIFGVLALCLAGSKIFKKKVLHKRSLFWTYIVMVYVCVLEFIIIGFGLEFIDNVLLLIGCAFCFLRWKFQTEYIDPKQFEAEVSQ